MSNTIVFADENSNSNINESENTTQIIIDVDDTKETDFTVNNNKFIESGKIDTISTSKTISTRSIPTLEEDIALNMLHYLQGDSRWKYVQTDKYDNPSHNIGNIGCAITSFAMITTNLSISNQEPDDVVYKLGYDPNDNNISYSDPFSYGVAASKYGISLTGSVHQTVTDTYAKSYIRGALRLGNPVMVGMFSPSTTHFIVAYGYRRYSDGTEEFLIKDTSGYTYTNLDDYLNNNYTVNRLKVFE